MNAMLSKTLILSCTQYNCIDKSNQNPDEDEARPDCTLFVTNIPHYFDFQNVMEIFSSFGPVESVVFQGVYVVRGNNKSSCNSSL